MLKIGGSAAGTSTCAAHRGYVAGRYRDGALSDTWTDVAYCALRTFVAYVPRCDCGWIGADQATGDRGYRTCQRLVSDHCGDHAPPASVSEAGRGGGDGR